MQSISPLSILKSKKKFSIYKVLKGYTFLQQLGKCREVKPLGGKASLQQTGWAGGGA
jgi:hypothetical protein